MRKNNNREEIRKMTLLDGYTHWRKNKRKQLYGPVSKATVQYISRMAFVGMGYTMGMVYPVDMVSTINLGSNMVFSLDPKAPEGNEEKRSLIDR